MLVKALLETYQRIVLETVQILVRDLLETCSKLVGDFLETCQRLVRDLLGTSQRIVLDFFETFKFVIQALDVWMGIKCTKWFLTRGTTFPQSEGS